MNAAFQPHPLRHALPQLFARYVAGQIADPQWRLFASVMDELDATAEERAAFARFFLDLISDQREEVWLPTPAELREILLATRA